MYGIRSIPFSAAERYGNSGGARSARIRRMTVVWLYYMYRPTGRKLIIGCQKEFVDKVMLRRIRQRSTDV